MSITDFAAWWGAVIATVVLIWDIYKWLHTGAELVMTICPNMYTINHPQTAGKRVFLIEVANKGDRPTTLTKLVFVYYDGFWLYFRRKREYFHVKNPGLEYSFPHKLDVGEIWHGFAFHGDQQEKMLNRGFLYATLYCSHRTHPVTVRI